MNGLLEKVQTGEPFKAEMLHCRRSGEKIPVETSAYLTGFQSEPAVLSVACDISKRRRAEEILRRSDERLRLATECAGMATWDVNWRTGAALWSETFFRMLGYEPDPEGRATMEMWRSRVHPEDLPRVMEAVDRARKDRSIYSPEHRVLRADNGQLVRLRVFGRFLYDELGEPSRFVGMVVADRELDQAEEAKKRLGAILRDASDAITVQDFEGRILAWNPAAERMYGWSEAEALELNVRGMVPESRHAELDEFTRRLAAGEAVGPFEIERTTKNGRILNIRLTATALLDASGNPYAIATTERELTGQSY
jgi:PAS domain S-box-containing protein